MKREILFVRLLFGCLALFGLGLNAADESIDRERLLERVKKGGLVLYFRHASTEKDYADQVDADVNNGSTQRVLSEKGWHEAVHIGRAFRYHNIPVGSVYSSQYFRAWQTAWLAFGKYEKCEALNFLPHAEFSKAQMETMKQRVSPFVCKVPLKGKNTVIVAHDDPFEAVTGIYPEPMGVCYIIEPKGRDGFKILGMIPPHLW